MFYVQHTKARLQHVQWNKPESTVKGFQRSSANFRQVCFRHAPDTPRLMIDRQKRHTDDFYFMKTSLHSILNGK